LTQRRSWAKLGTTGLSDVHRTCPMLDRSLAQTGHSWEDIWYSFSKNHQTFRCAPDLSGMLGGQWLCPASTVGRASSADLVSTATVGRVTGHVRCATEQSSAHLKRKVDNQTIQWLLHRSCLVRHQTVQCTTDRRQPEPYK
jgi:hypothetical protein